MYLIMLMRLTGFKQPPRFDHRGTLPSHLASFLLFLFTLRITGRGNTAFPTGPCNKQQLFRHFQLQRQPQVHLLSSPIGLRGTYIYVIEKMQYFVLYLILEAPTPEPLHLKVEISDRMQRKVLISSEDQTNAKSEHQFKAGTTVLVLARAETSLAELPEPSERMEDRLSDTWVAEDGELQPRGLLRSVRPSGNGRRDVRSRWGFSTVEVRRGTTRRADRGGEGRGWRTGNIWKQI